MENQTLKFKTNINCGGCIAAVKPHLDNTKGIAHWDVDTANKDKVLTIRSAGIAAAQIMETVQQAGYKIEPIPA